MFLDNLYFQRNSTNANQKERVNSLIFLETDKMKNNQIHQNLSFFLAKKISLKLNVLPTRYSG